MIVKARLLLISVGFSWLYYLNATYYFILRSGGDTKGCFVVDSLYDWAVMKPAAFIIGQLGFSLPIHFFLVQLLQFARLGMGYRLFQKGKWLNNLTKTTNS